MQPTILHALGRCVVQTSVAAITPRAKLGFALAVRLIGERGGKVARAELLELLWPRERPAAARHALSEALRKLRAKGLAIQQSAHSVWLPRERAVIDADVECDDWRGFIGRDVTILPGYVAPRSPAFNDWLDDWRAATARAVTSRLLGAVGAPDPLHDARTASALAGAMLRMDPIEVSPPYRPARDSTVSASAVLPSLGDAVPDLASRVSEPRVAEPRVAEPRGASHELIVRALDAAERGQGRIATAIPVTDAHWFDPLTLARLGRARAFAFAGFDCRLADTQRPLSMLVELVRTLRTVRGAAGANPTMNRYLDAVMLSYTGATESPWPPHVDMQELSGVRVALADLIDAILHEQPLFVVIGRSSAIDAASRNTLRELDGWATTRKLVVLLSLAPLVSREPEPVAAKDSPRAEAAGSRPCGEATGERST